MLFASLAYADKNTSHLRVLALLEREQRRAEIETMIRTKIAQLEELRTRTEQDTLPNTAMIGDQHGENDVFAMVIQAVKGGTVDEVIVEGDVFDRGGNSIENFDSLKELKELLGDKAVFCLGNHEIFLIRTILLNDESAREQWMLPENGGQAFLDECREKQRDPREIAMWVLKNFKLFHIDERVFLNVHAGVPVDMFAKPQISREQLDGWYEEFEAIKQSVGEVDEDIETSQRAALGMLFIASHYLFWSDDSRWVDNFEEFEVQGDEADGDVRLVPVVQKGAIDKALTMLSLNGVVSAHVLRDRALNMDNRILGIDVVAEDDGFLVFDKTGIAFNSKDESVRQLASKEQILIGIDEEILRLKTRLGEVTPEDEMRLAMHEAERDAEPPEDEPTLSLKDAYRLMEVFAEDDFVDNLGELANILSSPANADNARRVVELLRELDIPELDEQMGWMEAVLDAEPEMPGAAQLPHANTETLFGGAAPENLVGLINQYRPSILAQLEIVAGEHGVAEQIFSEDVPRPVGLGDISGPWVTQVGI